MESVTCRPLGSLYSYVHVYTHTHTHTHQHHITLQGVFDDYHFMAGSLYVMKVLEGGAAAKSGLVLENDILLTVSERVCIIYIYIIHRYIFVCVYNIHIHYT